MAAIDLTTVEAVELYGGIESASDTDAIISDLISAASRRFCEWIGRPLLTASYTDVFSGTGGERRTLPYYPVQSVTTVSINDIPISQRTSTLAPGWVLDGDAVSLVGYIFARGIKNCAIAFTAGYDLASMPEDIVQAIKELVLLKFREKDRPGQQSKTVGNETVSFNLSEAPQSVRDAVKSYARTGHHY